jgi:uncharacterized protein YcbX
MRGERLDCADVDARGLRGDRVWAVRDEEKGIITGGKKIPALMQCAARFVEEPRGGQGADLCPQVLIALPDGTELHSGETKVHERLSEFLGKRVSLQRLRPASDRQYYRGEKPTTAYYRRILGLADNEPLPDFSAFPLALLRELGTYATPRGTYFDAYPLHVVTTATLDALRAKSPDSVFDVRRFRPNLVVHAGQASGFVEVAWCEGKLRAGNKGFSAQVLMPTTRCSMTTRAHGDLSADPAVLRTISEHSNRCLGVYGTVATPGRVCVGDAVDVQEARASVLGKWAKARTKQAKRLLLKAVQAALPRGQDA